jgi:hypothetical protein
MRGRIARATGKANEKSAAGFASVRGQIAKALRKADKKSKIRFSKLFAAMTKQRRAQNIKLKRETGIINDKIAKQAALEDSRFRKTVKNIAAARAQATNQVKAARKSFATRIQTATAAIKDQESRLLGEIKVVGEELISHKATQLRVNRRTFAEMRRIRTLANVRYSASKRARGKLRRLLDENKKAASAEVQALTRSTRRAINAVRSQAARNAQDAAKDLTRATKKLYGKLAGVQRKTMMMNKRNSARIAAYSARSRAALYSAKRQFGARLSTLTNTVTANNRKTESLLAGLTGVIRDNKMAAKKDRALMRAQSKAMNADLNKKLVRSIQMGEARAKKAADRAREHLASTKRSVLIEISERVERTADKLFKTIQGNHKKIADNYLSLKAYAATCADKLKEYVAKGKGRNLSSLGDLLNSVTALAPVRAGKAEGIGAGGNKLQPIFGGKSIKVDNAPTKINALVDEYMGVVTAVRRRWPMGIGKYLLMRTESSMQGKGVLQVDKVANKAGNWVFVNGRAVGLSSKLNDFETLAVHMGQYEATLAKMTSKMTTKKKKKGPGYVKPPEWRGD